MLLRLIRLSCLLPSHRLRSKRCPVAHLGDASGLPRLGPGTCSLPTGRAARAPYGKPDERPRIPAPWGPPPAFAEFGIFAVTRKERRSHFSHSPLAPRVAS